MPNGAPEKTTFLSVWIPSHVEREANQAAKERWARHLSPTLLWQEAPWVAVEGEPFGGGAEEMAYQYEFRTSRGGS